MLTNRQKVFIEEYLQCWNSSEAARRAGYKPVNANRLGYKILHRPEVQAAIAERMREKAMQADEVLYRLTQHARVNPATFFNFTATPLLDDDGKPIIDDEGRPVVNVKMGDPNWERFILAGHLVRKISYDRQGRPVIEFVDNQAALIQLGRAHRLFVDQVDLNSHSEQTDVVIYLPDNGRGKPEEDANDEG